MSVEGPVPAAAPTGRACLARRGFGGLIAAAAVFVACARSPQSFVVATRAAPGASQAAFVMAAPCGTAWCESLWVGATADNATRIATLAPGTERCTEIAWTRDGRRVAFLINGHQLRVYDTASRAPAGQVDLVPVDASPTTRIARGVTFSDNGAAITFDDCPRDRSGCRPGLVAMR